AKMVNVGIKANNPACLCEMIALSVGSVTARLQLFTKLGVSFIQGLQRGLRFYRSLLRPELRRKERMANFHDLVEREIPRLRRYARALTRSADRADDLVQDTLVRAIAKAHLWQPGTDIRAWLFTLMHNQHVNLLRKQMRDEATVDVDQLSSSLVATTDPTGARQLCGTRKGAWLSPR